MAGVRRAAADRTISYGELIADGFARRSIGTVSTATTCGTGVAR